MNQLPSTYKQITKHQYIPTVEFYSLVMDTLEDYSVFTLDVK